MALDFLGQGRVDTAPLISHIIALDDIVARGFDMLLNPERDAVKVLVEFPQREAGAGSDEGA